MPIVRTDEWLEKHPLKLCERLTPYFEHATARGIYLHLTHHGMYSSTEKVTETVTEMKQKRIWERVDALYQQLRKRWNGPDIPIFIFPANARNRKLARDFNSKGGLAYHDKLFLFLLPHHETKEIAAVLTHEYNHVCRLEKQPKEEYTLLDGIILEGLAEQAVGQFVGKAYEAKWTTYYSDDELRKFWRKYVAPHQSIPPSHSLHDRLLYGRGWYPPLLGYAVGYGIVRQALQKGESFSKLMEIPSERIVQLSRFGE